MSSSSPFSDRPHLHWPRVAASVSSFVIAIISITPILWIVGLSLKSVREVLRPNLLPATPQFGNYLEAWTRYELGLMFFNSGFVTLFSVGLTVVAAMCGAYAFTKIKFRGSEFLFSMLLLSVIVPPSALVVPLLIEMRELGLYDTRTGLTLAYIAFGLPIATLIFRGFFASIPHEIIEAARIDGCSELMVLWRILAPLAKGAIATVTLLLFLVNWNEFILALVLLRDSSNYTLPLGINSQLGQYTSDYHLIAAASIIASIPIFSAYLLLQTQFERGVAEGALKG